MFGLFRKQPKLSGLELRSYMLKSYLNDYLDPSASSTEKQTYLHTLTSARTLFSTHTKALPKLVQALEKFPIQDVLAKTDESTGEELKEEWEHVYDCFLLHNTPAEVEKGFKRKFDQLIGQCQFRGVLPKGYRSPLD